MTQGLSFRRRDLLATASVAACLVAPAPFARAEDVYRVDYRARVQPTEKAAHVTIEVDNGARLLRHVRLRIDPARHREFGGNGEIIREAESVRWTPPAGPAKLTYTFRIDHLRDELSYDARCAESWAIFRGDDLIPPARVRTVKGARAAAHLHLNVPQGWSAVAPYPRASDESFTISHPDRAFDRPTGWLVVGELGVLRERIAGARTAVAGPRGQRLQRMDVLALLRWTLPPLRDMIGVLPDRVLIVMARDPMWRGGLSAPHSLFLHGARPLISEDGTSPVLHELVHSSLRLRPGRGGDWVIEGIAELYSMEALARSGTISRKRHRRALERMARRGDAASSLETDSSSGATTARAVTVLRALDAEIRAGSQDEASLEDAIRALAATGDEVTTAGLRAAAEQVSGVDLAAFFERHVGRPAEAPVSLEPE